MAKDNDDTKRINECENNIEKITKSQDEMAKDLSDLKDMLRDITHSLKTPEGISPDHDFQRNFQGRIPQIQFEGSQYYTKSPEGNFLGIKSKLPTYDGKDHRGAIVWVNKMEAIFASNPSLGSQ